MRSQKYLGGPILVLILLIAIGCGSGVSQGKYDKVSGDLATAQSQIANLQNDLQTANNKVTDLKAELQIAKSQHDKANSDLVSAKSQVTSLTADLQASRSHIDTLEETIGQASSVIDLINSVVVSSLKGEFSGLRDRDYVDLLFSWRDKVQAMEDPVMQQKFQAVIDAGEQNEQQTIDWFVYMFEKLSKALESEHIQNTTDSVDSVFELNAIQTAVDAYMVVNKLTTITARTAPSVIKSNDVDAPFEKYLRRLPTEYRYSWTSAGRVTQSK